MTPQGLYYNISCSCDLGRDQFYEVILCGKDMNQNLGILAPENKRLMLVKKIPAKNIVDDDLLFIVVVRDEEEEYDFYAIDDTVPFAHIDRLQNAVLLRKDGKVGVCIPR